MIYEFMWVNEVFKKENVKDKEFIKWCLVLEKIYLRGKGWIMRNEEEIERDVSYLFRVNEVNW